jgi:hypothetical protein
MRAALILALLLATTSASCAKLLSVYDDSYQCPVAKSKDKPCEPASTAYLRALARPGLPPPPDPLRDQNPTESGDAWQPPVRTVWLAPFVDSAGRRHEATLMRVVVMPGPPIVRPEPEFLVPPVPMQADDGTQVGPPVPPAEAGSPSQTGNRGNSLLNQYGARNGTTRPGPNQGFGQQGGFQIPGRPQTQPGSTGGFNLPGY